MEASQLVLSSSSNLTFQNLNFTRNCNEVASFTGLYFWGTRDLFMTTYRSLNRYVASALPPGAPPPSKCEVMSWFERVYQDSNVTEYMYRRPFNSCLKKTCKAIDYPGNADIAGIGMLAAYSIEALMVTMYLAAFVLQMVRQRTTHPTRIRRTAKKWTVQDLSYRFMDAIQFTIDDFLDTAMLFCFSVVVAGLVIIPTSKKTYDMLQLSLVAGFTLSAVLAIWPLQKQTMRRKLVRNCFLALVIILAFVEVGAIIWTNKAHEFITLREYDCLREIFDSYEKPSLFFLIIQALTAAAVVLVLVLIFFEITPLPPNIMNMPAVRFIRRVPWGWIVCVYGFANIWLSLGTLFWVRGLVKERMKVSGPERSWDFGQVMALATWLPVQTLFIDIMIRGSDPALESRIAQPWKVSNDEDRYQMIRKDKKEHVGEKPGEMSMVHSYTAPAVLNGEMDPERVGLNEPMR